jgi:ribulose-5-phosphate 4-epimerase/fuculose-1-phosphate aldolase
MSNIAYKPHTKITRSTAEQQARIDLAAAHRLAGLYGWTHLIYNHFTMRVPGEPQHFLVKPHNERFEEVTASSLIKVDMAGKSVDSDIDVAITGVTIHSAVFEARADINCVMHAHTAVGMAISAHPKGLLPITQSAMRFYDRLGYHDYEGVSDAGDERVRIAADLGPRANAMILRNHGLLTCGATVGLAFGRMYHLMLAAQSQLMVEATGQQPLVPPPEVCEHAAKQVEKYDREASGEWVALLRKLEQEEGTQYRA